MAIRISEKELREMWTSGVPTNEIAIRMKCHRDTILARAEQIGLPRRPHGGARRKAVQE